jgi:hypothetical protein
MVLAFKEEEIDPDDVPAMSKEQRCNVTKTVTLRSGDMIWRYDILVPKARNKEDKRGFVLIIQLV